jgi:hypothetical protein
MKVGATLLGLLFGGQFACSSSPFDPCEELASHRPSSYSELDFYGLLTLGIDAHYPRASSVNDLAVKSDRVVVGRFANVSEGPTTGGLACTRSAKHTTHLTVHVEEVVRGQASATVVIETARSRVVKNEDLAEKLPADRVLVFVVDVARYPGPQGPIPSGRLFYFYTPLGLILDGPGGPTFPLEHEKAQWLDLKGLTVDQVVALLKQPQ